MRARLLNDAEHPYDGEEKVNASKQENAKCLLRAATTEGARAGDDLKDFDVHFLGNWGDVPEILNFAERQGWIEWRAGEKYPRLTEAGFVAAEFSN